jgi:hypothetical protein
MSTERVFQRTFLASSDRRGGKGVRALEFPKGAKKRRRGATTGGLDAKKNDGGARGS